MSAPAPLRPPVPGGGSRGLHRFAIVVCAATFFLVFAGGLVTSTGSGLAVPDWPLSFGRFFPPMVGGVFYEHGHRMVAAGVGLLVVALYVWCLAGRARRAVSTLAACALGAVVLQGLLGGLTVLLKLPPVVSVSHACLAQAFLCLTVTLAAVTGASWERAAPARLDSAAVPLRTLSLAATAAIYGQLVLGAVVRHLKAGLAIPDFPLAFGRIVPPLDDPLVQIAFAHRAGALVAAVLAVWTSARILRSHAGEAALRRPALLLPALLAVQILLGGAAVWTRRAVIPTTLHVVVGAALLATAFLITLRAFRLLAPAGAERAAGAAREALA